MGSYRETFLAVSKYFCCVSNKIYSLNSVNVSVEVEVRVEVGNF